MTEDGVASRIELVESVHQVPYGRSSDRSVSGLWREGRGTCSTKHLYLFRRFAEELPLLRPRLIHRVYTITPDEARDRFGEAAAATVPPQGLTDVHRYLVLSLEGRDVTVDATFPGPPWDGYSSMELACGEGVDFSVLVDAAREKRELEERFCDAHLREPFIAVLGSARDD